MAEPKSSPLPYTAPLGEAAPRVYVVERLTEDELRDLDHPPPSAPELEESGLLDELPSVRTGLRELRARAR